MRSIIFKLFLTAIMATVFITARSQETNGAITGTVTDDKKELLESVSVKAVHTPSGTAYSALTDKSGRYFLPGLRIGGPYELEITMTGKQPQKKNDITIRLGEPLQLDFQMENAQTQLAEVVVTAVAGSAKANVFGAGQNISRTQLNNMPTINRSLQDITKLVPQGSKDNSFGGTNFRYNNITIDGAINNDAIGFSPSMGGITGTSGAPGSSTRSNAISLDAIEDMQVYLAPFDVKIGNFTGASINAVTRSGTNKVSGSIYGFGRNASMIGKDKVSSLGKMNSDFHDYQAGFRIGFPIIKNKLFFFSNQEITNRRDPVQLLVGNEATNHILSAADAETIRSTTISRYGNVFDPGTAGAYNGSSKSTKFFNRIDWNINAKHQLALRNNTILSEAVHIDRDQQDFRFSSMAFEQKNDMSSTVLELKSRFNNKLSNSFIAGYSIVKDRRTPTQDPALPQVQIMGRTPGTTIYLGTDREASVFNMKQRTIEITNNLTYRTGIHTLLFGTHNELYKIDYGFVNSWNGRVDYLSIDDYLNNVPYRVRGSYNFNNNSRQHILDNPEAVFNVNMMSVYAQDEIQVTPKLKLTPGLRADYVHLPTKPELSSQVRNALTDSYFGSTYTYTPLDRIDNSYLNKVQLSPRIGFRYLLRNDQSLVLRGGTGIFLGRIPFAWLAYAYYNNGLNYGSFDQRADNKAFITGTDPVRPGQDGIAGFVGQNGVDVKNRTGAKTQVDLIDNNFQMPSVWRTNVAVDYTTSSGYKLSFEGIITKTIKDVLFQQLNTSDNPRYYGYDSARRQPVYSGTVNPEFSNAYLLSNTSKGFRYNLTATVSRNFRNGFNFMFAYTYGLSKDLSNGIRNSMESAWQLNQALVPNNPGLAFSNFDIRNRFVLNTGYTRKWNDRLKTSITLFASLQSGSPFTYGIVNNSIQGLSQQVSLAYIPRQEEAINFFQDYTNGSGTVTAAQQATAFNQFVDRNDYLSKRRGDFTERNGGRTPWNLQTDLHIGQDIFLSKNSNAHFITVTLDIINVANLLNANWGRVYFSPNTFNSTSSVGLTPMFPSRQNPGNYPVYQFTDPGTPYSIDFFNSRAQMQLGVRYSF
jgi:hypothetical protein